MDATCAATISAFVAGIGLILNFVAFLRRQKLTQLSLLADFTSRYLGLIDKQEEYRAKGKQGEFAVLFLNLLEWFAYMVNHKYLPEEMARIYRGVIVNWHDKMWDRQKEALLTYMEDQPQKFAELDKLYARFVQ